MTFTGNSSTTGFPVCLQLSLVGLFASCKIMQTSTVGSSGDGFILIS
ncbi:hypothetical protein BFJ66_g13048 [Fusarium oxysporum f. sp. cepae]|uniref:Uncharacterized protein n=1 Tax=Fusarium oxysporum f. sp. cepae TaxID=396571 RepID=A0A3L6NMR7_FUSOX|nr:hypothetical protein BFJ65_g6437 [Fusarium oxysporum f. sp. cepae]RKK37279.1 hypothetical protein BFJ66_g13048 [Fusarium oxysporum f. sp. cepae]